MIVLPAPRMRPDPVNRPVARGCVVLLLSVVAGCGAQTYRARPLTPAASAQAFADRSLADERLRTYAGVQGVATDPWPLPRWGLAQLIVAAMFFHPDIELARARARVSTAETQTSRTRPPVTINVRPEYNTKVGAGASPWGLGMVVGLPIDLGGKRAARTAQLERLEAATTTDVGVAAWRVRSRLRRHFVDLYAARELGRALDAEQQQRRILLALLEKREQAGYAAASEAAAQRLRLAETEVAIRRAAIRRDQSLAGVAEAVGIPLAALDGIELDVDSLAAMPPPPTTDGIRRAALHNRIDLHRKLDDYAAAEAAVRLEIARRYPDLILGPGYFWDADHSVWSIAFLALGVGAARTDALVREAEARREVEEKAFLALQANVIAEAAGAVARYQRAREAEAAVHAQIEQLRARTRQVERQFDRGHADRVELVQARADALVAERTALPVMLEAQQALSALEDAVQRPLDDPEFAASTPTAAAPTDRTLNPALLDND